MSKESNGIELIIMRHSSGAPRLVNDRILLIGFDRASLFTEKFPNVTNHSFVNYSHITTRQLLLSSLLGGRATLPFTMCCDRCHLEVRTTTSERRIHGDGDRHPKTSFWVLYLVVIVKILSIKLTGLSVFTKNFHRKKTNQQLTHNEER